MPSPLKRTHLEHFLDKASCVLDILSEDVVLLGDFNQRDIEWTPSALDSSLRPGNYDSPITCEFVDFLSAYDLKQYNHVLNHQKRLLDLVLSNSNCEILIQESLSTISRVDLYHPPLQIFLFSQGPLMLSPKFTPRHNFFKGDYDRIRNFLSEVDWNLEFKACISIDDVVSRFYIVINKVISDFVPVQKQNRKKYPPWFSINLIRLLREKEKARQRYKKFKNSLDELEYNILRTRSSVMIKKCYNIYIRRVVSNVVKNPKYFWAFIKNKRKVKSDIPLVMNFGDRIAKDGDNIANLFADSFALAYGATDDPVPVDVDSSREVFSLGQLYLTSDQIEKSLRALDLSKGAGCDGVHPVFLKNCAAHLKEPLHIIYNRSLSEGRFPKMWKDSIIVPIYKAGDRCNVTNYRPISILPVLAKVFESLVCPYLSWYIKQTVADQQHGFLKKRSTATNLLTFVDGVIANMSSGKEVDAIYTDFSKAFDKVDHALLLQKLYNIFGIHESLLNWFSSYLRDRTQRVECMDLHLKQLILPLESHKGRISDRSCLLCS